MTRLECAARDFAEYCHQRVGQTRNYTGEPYICHSEAVAELVKSVWHTQEMLAAAWLHDVIEDTDATLDDIRIMFGPYVAELVKMLTDVSKPGDGNRAVRKAIDLAHTVKASPAAQTIKLADLIDNTRSIVDRDPEFARVYLKEKAALLEVLRDGDPILWKMAHKILTLNARE